MRLHPTIDCRAILGAFALGLLIALFATAPAVQASEAVIGTFGGPGGEGNGQLDQPQGIAVNVTGAGDVNPGDVYIVDSGNNRIDEFSASGVFVRAFGYDVVASGPGNTGTNEKQSVNVEATGGTFTISITRSTFADTIDGSNVINGVGAPTSAFHIGDKVQGAFPAGTTITAVGTESLILSENATATFHRAEFKATETTTAVPYDTTPGELEAALEALPAIGSGNVVVAGGPGSTAPLTIEYTGALGHDDAVHSKSNAGEQASAINAVSTSLSGGTHTATITTTTLGGGYEICDASEPNSVCKAGPHCNNGESSPEACPESSAAGSLDDPNGIAIDQKNGNVYVVDATENSLISSNRVNIYSAAGAFEGAFGWNVDATNPKEELQFCTATTGCQRGSAGSGTGELGEGNTRSNPAVAPVGAPDAGNLLLPDGGNARAQEFAPILNGSEEVTGIEFLKSFGWDVVASGPDQSSEIQRVLLSATAGRFKLTFGPDTTGELLYNASAKEVEDALDNLGSIDSGGGSVTVTGGPGDASGDTPYIVTFDGGSLAHTNVAQMSATKVGLSGGSPTSGVSVETYSNGTEGLESCVIADGDVCKIGTEGGRMGQFGGEISSKGPTSIAVDKSGAVYAVNERTDPCGSEFNSPTQFKVPCRVYKFTFPAPDKVIAKEFAPSYLTHTNSDAGLAVSATDVAFNPESQHVLVARKEGEKAFKFFEFDSSGTLLQESPGEGGLNSGSGDGGLAIGVGKLFYFSNSLGMIDIFGPPPAPVVSIAPVTNIGATSTIFHGTVTPPSPIDGTYFDTTYHFEYSTDGANWSSFPDVDVDVGDGSGTGSVNSCRVNNPSSCTVEQTVPGLVPGAHYQVRLVASTGTAATSASQSFVTEMSAPSISGITAEEVGATSAKLSGFINPNNEPTTYHFEWGTDTGYSNRAPLEAEESVGSGGQSVKVTVGLEGLKSGAIYHFRLVATNPSGTTDASDREFSTLNRYGLPDARAPEQVSPNDKRPVGMVAQLMEGQLTFQVSNDGSSIIYPLQNGVAEATSGGDVEYMGQRGTQGWLSTQLTPPSLVPAVVTGIGADKTGTVLYASADLSCELLESFEPLSIDTPAEDVADGVRNLYRRNADGSYTLLSVPVPFNTGGAGYHVDWASADCSHVLFETGHRLLEGAPGSGSTLYEWSEGKLRLAGIRPDESSSSGEGLASDAVAGLGSQQTTWNSVSADGSKVFFTATSAAGADKGNPAVFVRENGTNTVDASQSQTATVDLGAHYAMASADGSHVFFLANYGLATNGTSTGANTCSSEGGAGCDLYDYNTHGRTLTDLSVDSSSADASGAGVIGLFDVSDDGSYAYFAARGQLVPNEGNNEVQNLQGNGTYNVYLSHEGVLSYVGPIDTEDASDDAFSGSDVSFGSSHWVSDATPDGKHLLFVSKANVTGYESKGVTEAYMYSAETGETVCVSCRPDGLPSDGDRFTEPITVDPQLQDGVPQVTTVLNRPRSISDDGRRVFFTMPDVLAAGAKSRTRNIYEWEAGQVYLLVAGEGVQLDFTRYADASASGNDVFLVTKAKLVAQDFDSTTDVYDLRVGGGFAEPAPVVPPCDPLADECQEAPMPQPLETAGPSSATFSGPGNPSSAVQTCRKGYVREHGKCVSKKPASRGKKPVSKDCKKDLVRKHGKCVKRESSHHKRVVGNHRRAR